MKKKGFYAGLYGCCVLLGAALLALNLAQLRWAGVFTGLLMFPYQPIGYGLRQLSLLGGVWDTLAWGLYLGLGLLPLVPLLGRWKKRIKPGSAWMGLPVSLLTYITLYYMVNPGLLKNQMGLTLAGTTEGLLAAWLTLWAMERLEGSSHQGRLDGLKWLLAALDVALVAAVCGGAPPEYLAAVKATAAANTALLPEELVLTNGFLLGKALVENLPLVLDMLLVHRVLALVEGAGREPFGVEAAAAAMKLAFTAKRVVLAQVSAQVLFHLAQLGAAPWLRSVAVSVQLPLFSVLFGVGAMVLARWMAQGREMREENDSFI